mmetsp:Transcript_12418/g.40659  ORF Transcript_12418/g.40659 Transcript_12418/m.40659 type:complete len:100 (-) Transcript_12418:2447-2746(-)
MLVSMYINEKSGPGLIHNFSCSIGVFDTTFKPCSSIIRIRIGTFEIEASNSHHVKSTFKLCLGHIWQMNNLANGRITAPRLILLALLAHGAEQDPFKGL